MIGIDLVDPDDLVALTSPLTSERIFTAAERAGAQTGSLLEVFAAKEALLKALGWGLERGVARLAEIEVERGDEDLVTLRAGGRVGDELARRRAEASGLLFRVGEARGAVVVAAASREAAGAILADVRHAVAERKARFYVS